MLATAILLVGALKLVCALSITLSIFAVSGRSFRCVRVCLMGRADLWWDGSLSCQNVAREVNVVGACERRPARQELKKDGAHAPEICLGIIPGSTSNASSEVTLVHRLSARLQQS